MSKQPDKKEVDVETLSTTSSSTTTTTEQPSSKPSRTNNILKTLFHKDKTSNSNSEETDNNNKKEKKESISSSGPYIFVKDPVTGKETLRQNPHWPNEDSWKEVERSKGTWAMGSEMGESSKDFGGTVG